jgi:hypothetical protein
MKMIVFWAAVLSIVALPQGFATAQRVCTSVKECAQIAVDSAAQTQEQVSKLRKDVDQLPVAKKSLAVYQCPSGKAPNTALKGGPWAFYGCTGQITSQSTCQNIEWPTQETRECESIGRMHLFAN